MCFLFGVRLFSASSAADSSRERFGFLMTFLMTLTGTEGVTWINRRPSTGGICEDGYDKRGYKEGMGNVRWCGSGRVLASAPPETAPQVCRI